MSSPGQPYYRLSGNGNDFLALVEPEAAPSSHQIRAWCRRGIGLGADGVFLLSRPELLHETGAEGATPTIEMAHFNADGGEAELCLNGTRCAARLAFALGWASREVVIETPAGAIFAATEEDGTIRVEVPMPPPPERHEISIPGQESSLLVWLVEVGVPHAVLEVAESLGRLDPDVLGPALRNHRQFAPRGANVDFVRFPQSHALELRTWERGVEGETLACGTGILAAIRVGLDLGRLELPARVQTLGGFPTRVEESSRIDPEGDRRYWALISDARLLAHGEITEEAELTPPQPFWAD